MPPEAISVRVPDDLLAAVDSLVRSGDYTGRSDFIVKAVRRAVDPVKSGSTENVLLLPFRPDPWPATAAKNLVPHPAGLDWLLDEMGVITLHAGAPATGTVCVLPTLGRDGYRVCNLWYRYLSGTATPGVHFVRPGGEVDLLPSPGKNHPLDLWDHPEANGASLDYNDISGTAPVLRAFPVLRAPNVIYAGLEAQGASGSFVSFQLYAVVERVASRVPGSPGHARTPGPYAAPADSRDVQAEGPRGLSPSEVAELQAKTLEAAASLVANSTGRAQDVALCAHALRVRADAFRTRTVLESRLLEERSKGIMPARGETRRPAEPEHADERTSAWIRTSRGRFVREEIPCGGREASFSLAMEKADAALAWDGWELPGDVGEIVESAGSVAITRDAAWEDGFRKRIDAGIDATWGEHRGVWYQGSGLYYRDGSRHYLINHVNGELGKLSGDYATEAHVVAAIDGYLDMAELLAKTP